MAKWTVIASGGVSAEQTYQAPRDVDGVVSSRRLQPDGYPLWMCESSVRDGARIRWSDRHGDDAVYVRSGELVIAGHHCPAGGAVIVESGVVAEAIAVGATEIYHFGSTDDDPPANGLFGPPRTDVHGVHVVGPAGMFRSGEREGVSAVWFADGTCETCRCQLFEVEAPPNHVGKGKPHSHSADEIIYLLEGTLRLGAYTVEPFSALCIPADVRYSLVGGPEGHRFLNFRRDVSEQIYERTAPPILETGLARGGHATSDVR